MPYVLSHRTQQRLAVAGLLTCLIALAAELTVHIAAHMARGGNVVGGLLTYVSYYTVGSNILLVAVTPRICDVLDRCAFCAIPGCAPWQRP